MNVESILRDYFSALDDGDVTRFLAFFTPDCEVRFGNAPATRGTAALRMQMEQMAGAIARSRHVVSGSWSGPGTAIARGEVTYARRDGAEIAIAFMTYFRFDGDAIAETHVVADLAPLFAPVAQAA